MSGGDPQPEEQAEPQPAPQAADRARMIDAIEQLRAMMHETLERSGSTDYAAVEFYLTQRERAAGIFAETIDQLPPKRWVAACAVVAELAIHQAVFADALVDLDQFRAVFDVASRCTNTVIYARQSRACVVINVLEQEQQIAAEQAAQAQEALGPTAAPDDRWRLN